MDWNGSEAVGNEELGARQELKRQLYSYQDVRRELSQAEELLRAVESKMHSPKSAGCHAVPHRSGFGDPLLSMVDQYIKLEQKCKRLYARLLESQLHIEDLIYPLGPEERLLMRYYYIEGLTMKQAGEKMGYAERQAHRIHAGALHKLTIALYGCTES